MKFAIALIVVCAVIAVSEARGGRGGGGGRWRGNGGGWRGMNQYQQYQQYQQPATVVPTAAPEASVDDGSEAVAKRDTESESEALAGVAPTGMPIVPPVPTVPSDFKPTVCSFSTKKSIFSCTGSFNFECDAVPDVAELTGTVRAQDLTVVPDEFEGEPIFRLFSRTNNKLNDFTVMDKEKKEIVLSIYNKEKFAKENNGVFIKNTECWSAFVNMIHEIVPLRTIGFTFIVDKE